MVQDALEMMKSWSGSNWSSLTPTTRVASGSWAGAEITTRVAPASRCAMAISRLVPLPVASTTTSTPSSPQGSALGSGSASIRMRRAPTTMVASSTVTGSG